MAAREISVMNRVFQEVFGPSEIEDCRTYRVEVRLPDGKNRFYALRAESKENARQEAVSIVESMVQDFEDERVIWRLAGDNNWTFGGYRQYENTTKISKPKMTMKRILNYFFELED